MRALVRNLLVEGLDEDSDIPPARWAGSSGFDGRPATPFAEIKFSGQLPGMGAVRRRRIEVWLHDEKGSYDTIEELIKFVKSRLDGAEHVTDEDGNELISCRWVSDSVDLYDDGYGTNCMNTSFEIIGKETP